MNRLCFVFCLLSISTLVYSQALADWENPEVFAINKEAPRATALPYPDRALAVIDDYWQSPYYQQLDGLWKFYYVPRIADLPNGFFREDYDVSRWAEMPVPGTWELNGYGKPSYIGVGYGIPVNPPYIDRENSPTGAYRHVFDIPASWSKRRVFLHFEAGTNSMYIWVNGKKVGYTENSKSPAEFDITPYIRPGRNTLACEVHKYSDGYYLEDQDMWRLGGINRSVYLYSTAQMRILDFFAHADLDADYKDGLFSIDVKLRNYAKTVQKGSVAVEVLDQQGRDVLRVSGNSTTEYSVSSNGMAEVTVSGVCHAPLHWTAETPNLYTVLVTLKDRRGDVIESTSHKIGFRKVEIRDGNLLVNGKKIWVKGVNLHEFGAYTGNVVTRKEMLRNIQLMKELNVNAVRTSHYPQSPLWYKLCDEYGLYIVDENNLESHGLGFGQANVSNLPEWQAAHLDRMQRLVERDKNHPCVIVWSLGNEASNGEAYFKLYDWAKNRDASRPVQYEQAYSYRESCNIARNSDIICPMYPTWNSMLVNAEKDLGMPYIFCEYAHAMGNSMGNFQDYWDLMRSSKNMQGGFIWEWYNQGYPAYTDKGEFYWGYGGDLDGKYDPSKDNNFCMDGVVSPDQQYLPHSYIVKKVYQNIIFEADSVVNGSITVSNDFQFTDITPDNYDFKWQLIKNGIPEMSGYFSLNVPANSRKRMQLPLPDIKAEAGTEYYLQVFAYTRRATELIPAGFEVAKGEFSLSCNQYFVENNGNELPTCTTPAEGNELLITKGEYAYTFLTNDTTKSMADMRYKGKSVFVDLPRFNFWRAVTDNDMGNKVHTRLRAWRDAGNRINFRFAGSWYDDSETVVKYNCKIGDINAVIELTYTVNVDGSLTIAAHYKGLSDDVPEMVRFGMLMTLPKDYETLTYYGRGDNENYIDRNSDAFMGIYTGKVAEQAFPYYRPQESGNHTDVRWLTVGSNAGGQVRVDGMQPLSVSVTRNFPSDLDPGDVRQQKHPVDIPERDVAVMCIDLFQRGLAGMDSWSYPPLDKYRFYGNKEYKYQYTIKLQ